MAITDFGRLETPPHRARDIPDLTQATLAWRDNAAFVWWDIERSVYGQIHVSTTPNGEGSRARCAIQVGDRSFELEEPLEPSTFDSASIRTELQGRISVDADGLRLRLEMEPILSELDWATLRALPEAGAGLTLNHYQHGFRVSGEAVTVDGVIALSGSGWRDRTWGYREESLQWVEHFYLCSVFDDELAVVLWKSQGADGRLRTFGWKVDEQGLELFDSFTLTRDATSSFAAAEMTLARGALEIVKREKPTLFRGWWLPMGRSRQTGPTFGEFDEYLALEMTDGRRGGGVAAHGILRRLS